MTKYISLDKERIRQAFAEDPDECWAALEPICEWLSQWASSLPKRDTEPSTTLVACTHCQRGVKPKYAIHGLCTGCARELIKTLWQVTLRSMRTCFKTRLRVVNSLGRIESDVHDIRKEYQLWQLDKHE